MPTAKPDPAFKTRLREQFVKESTAPHQDTGSRRSSRADSKRWRRPTRRTEIWVTASVTLLAASLLLLAVLRRAPQWTVVRTDPQVALTIDGQSFAGTALTQELLVPGARLTSGDQDVTLRAEREMIWVLTPNTTVTLPRTRGWRRSSGEITVHQGELRISTGPDYRMQLLIETPEAHITVVGTTLAVIRNDQGTCLCVYEGTVQMDHLGNPEPAREVPAGKRWLIQVDGSALPLEDLEPMENMKLQMLHDQSLTDFQAGSEDDS
jgi:hypothetical protein